MNIFALDPGPEHSAYCRLKDGAIGVHGWVANAFLLDLLRGGAVQGCIAVIESPQAQDRPLGKLLRDTIWWAARFSEALDSRGIEWHEADERDVCLWLTGNRSGNNSAILQSLKDVFGDIAQVPCEACERTGRVPGVRKSKLCPECHGAKFTRQPGPLAGLNEHERSALSAAWWFWQRAKERRATA